jgi:hypothetical protein
MRPDYAGGSLVNLVASVVAARGGVPHHEPLRNFALDPEAKNLILLIIDGLGDNLLMRRAAGGELARRRKRAITSVFPSTTASAITTSYTGRTPLEHGLTGWFTYFGEAGCVTAPLPFRSRGDYLSLLRRGITPQTLFTVPSLFAAMPVKNFVVTYGEIVNSQYNSVHCRGAERIAYDDADGLVAGIEQAVKSGGERKFIYAYWPHYDAASHPHGCESPQALCEIEIIDAAFGELVRRLEGTDSVIVATADHGFVDVAPEESLELPPSLLPQLRFPLCGERRVVYCHVHSPDAFLSSAREWLGDKAEVIRSKRLVDEGWLGPGEPHPRIAERIGDVTLMMKGRYTVKDWLPGEPRWLHIGNHGGTHEDEMLIPLILEEA